MSLNDLTPSMLKVLRHMLGLDTWYWADQQPNEYRDYYCAAKRNTELQAMERLGLVECYRRDDQHDWFTTTQLGKFLARASVEIRHRSKGARRYARFLQIADSYPDVSFREFLTDPYFAEARATA